MKRERLEESYRGHSVIIEVVEAPAGQWGWYLEIDRCISHLDSHRFPDADAAIQAGLQAARAELDWLPP